jgi:protein-disulfide isomerase/uncharacterized membrane protein
MKKIPSLSILIFLALGMIGVSSYLTWHYYELYFPDGFSSGSLCNLSSFWNCDQASLSPLGSIFSIPTGLFGIYLGVVLLLGIFFFWSTALILSGLNSAACLGFFVYSMVYMGGLCPGCFIYYILSWGFFFVMVRSRAQPEPFKPLPILFALILFPPLGFWVSKKNEEGFEKQKTSMAQYVAELKQTPNLEHLPLTPAHWLSQPKEGTAPLRLIFFSDFECQACKLLGEMVPQILAHYKDKVSLGYAYYPLDKACNDEVSLAFHPKACDAARLAHCSGKDFPRVHDLLYENQNSLDKEGYLTNLAQDLGFGDCFKADASLEAVKTSVAQGKAFAITSTPTILVNGYKLEGLFPLRFMLLIFDEILKESPSDRPS